MKHRFSIVLMALLLGLLPGLAGAAVPVLTLRGTVAAGTGVNVTAFVDQVEVLDAGTGTVVANVVPNASFELTGSLGTGASAYQPTGASWAFVAQSGLATNGSTFNNPAAPAGTHVAFLQSTSAGVGSFSQPLPGLGTGSYLVRVQLAQRNTGPANQGVQVLLDGVVLGTFTPPNDGTFRPYTTATPAAVTNALPFTFSPPSGWPGTLVTVTGAAGPTTASTAFIPTATPTNTIVSKNATSLTFIVGEGAKTGPIQVTTPTGILTSATNFEVTTPPGFEEVDTVSTPANGGYTALVRCDDCFEQINLGFSFAFFSNTYTSCYINNNGVVSFGAGVASYSPQAFPSSSTPIIAPLWADVDTRSGSSGRVWYKLYPDRLVVLWSRVGYYDYRSDKKNTFQLILRRNTVAPVPAADVTFAYGALQWLSGDASGGANPQVGFDAGDGTNYFNGLYTRTGLVPNLSNRCLNYGVSQNAQYAFTNSQYSAMGFGPNPVGVGQEVTATGGGLAGATRVVANGAEATLSMARNTPAALSFRVPPTATLAGVSAVATPLGAQTSAGALAGVGLNVLPEPGQALAFDGTDDRVSVPHAPALSLGPALTVEAWVRTSSSAERYVLTKGNAAWQLAVNPLGTAAGRAGFALKTGGSPVWLTGTSTISDGHWHHIAGTYDGTTARLYVDAVLESSLPLAGAVAIDTGPLLLGCNAAGTNTWLGSLDEVRIWRTARSAAELEAGLRQAPALPNSALAAYFNFDRGTPGGDNRAYTTLFDVASGLPATLSNMALTGAVSNFVESYAMVLPAALTATLLTPTSFRLQWQPPARGSVSSYIVETSRSPAFTVPTTYTVTVPAALPQTIPAAANTTYYYRVRAERIYGVSGQGAYAKGSFTTPAASNNGGCPLSLDSFTPVSGEMGSTVVTLTGLFIRGTGLSADTVKAVTFGGVPATRITVVNNTTITVTVPPGAVTGPIVASNRCGSVRSTNLFTVNAPTLSAVSPVAELPGQTVTLTGTGLMPTSTVSFGGQPAVAVTYVSPTQLRVVVPVPAVGYENRTSLTLSSPNGSAPQVLPFKTLQVARPSSFNTCVGTACTTAFNTCFVAPAVTAPADNNWRYVLNAQGQVVLAFNSQGRNLGTVSASYLLADPGQAVRRDPRSQYYLGRNWQLTSSAGPFSGSSVLVRYYGLLDEYAQLQAADPARVTSLASLRLTQYSGPNEDCVLANNNNGIGTSQLLAPTTTYGPDGSGFFVAEAVVPNHFSEFYLAATPTAPLPVELVDFTATAAGPAAVRLAWTTASEKNSARFEVERSTNGVSFAAIGQLAGQGTRPAPTTYELFDRQPPAATLLYYRLRQVDLDGTFSYSPVRTVALSAPAAGGLVLVPNPARATALLGAAAGAPVEVFDALGRRVLSTSADATCTARLVLPAGLGSGVYVVRSGAHTARLLVE